MKTIYNQGLIIGKFMPFHLGHKAMIDFALEYCRHLIVAVCSLDDELIPGTVRYQWVKDTYQYDPRVQIVHITENLPSSSESSREISLVWSKFLGDRFPGVDVIVSSEKYGEYAAEYMNIDHLLFDQARVMCPVSGTQIRDNPIKYRNYIVPVAQPYFVKKITILGSESTGKSMMVQKLADYFDTVYVPEMARLIVSHTDKVVKQDLYDISWLHAREIQYKQSFAHKLLFIDTDSTITKSYSRYLFDSDLSLIKEIENVGKSDLYIYLDSDCTYVQDGTRLDIERRNELDLHHRTYLTDLGIDYIVIGGSDWQDRVDQCIALVKHRFAIS